MKKGSRTVPAMAVAVLVCGTLAGLARVEARESARQGDRVLNARREVNVRVVREDRVRSSVGTSVRRPGSFETRSVDFSQKEC